MDIQLDYAVPSAALADYVTLFYWFRADVPMFEDLEHKEQLIQLLDGVRDGEGVRIFIGAETRLFSLSGSAVIAAPYMTGSQRVVGAIGVIGPARLNYARVIPLVDYTARVLGQVMNA